MNQKPLDFFREITKIPRDSNDEKAIGEYLLAFAKDRGLEAEMDDAFNVVIRKPGTPGREQLPALALQSHTDMVYIKSADSDHNYSTPLELVEENGFLSAKGTSLGADNGIGMACTLALLDSTNAPHPPLEGIFTSAEEVGMQGAIALAPSAITSKRMINLDSEEEGVFIVGCAGGVTPTFTRKADWATPAPGRTSFQITVDGLLGGHSGMEIHKGRANAIRLLARVLLGARIKLLAQVGQVGGGGKTNAIPNHASAVVCVEDPKALQDLVKQYQEMFQNELSASDAGVQVHAEPCEYAGNVMGEQALSDILLLLYNIPNSVQTMSKHLDNLVESSCNIGVLACEGEDVRISCSARSSVGTLKTFMQEQMSLLAGTANAKLALDANYPEWAYATASPLRDKAVMVYAEAYGGKPEIKAIHAGLECGFFKSSSPDMDILSMGPNVYDVHTPQEKLDLASVERTYQFLLKLVAELA